MLYIHVVIKLKLRLVEDPMKPKFDCCQQQYLTFCVEKAVLLVKGEQEGPNLVQITVW